MIAEESCHSHIFLYDDAMLYLTVVFTKASTVYLSPPSDRDPLLRLSDSIPFYASTVLSASSFSSFKHEGGGKIRERSCKRNDTSSVAALCAEFKAFRKAGARTTRRAILHLASV